MNLINLLTKTIKVKVKIDGKFSHNVAIPNTMVNKNGYLQNATFPEIETFIAEQSKKTKGLIGYFIVYKRQNSTKIYYTCNFKTKTEPEKYYII